MPKRLSPELEREVRRLAARGHSLREIGSLIEHPGALIGELPPQPKIVPFSRLAPAGYLVPGTEPAAQISSRRLTSYSSFMPIDAGGGDDRHRKDPYRGHTTVRHHEGAESSVPVRSHTEGSPWAPLSSVPVRT